MSVPRDLSLPPFRPRFPWLGRHLQTARNFLVPEPPTLTGERLELPTQDGSGDRLAAVASRPPPAAAAKPTVVLVHGLSGSQDSRYMLSAAHFLLQRGHPVVRLNLRGAGPSRQNCRFTYHAGSSADLRDALLALPGDLSRPGVVIVGFSLGGNVVLKFAAEFATNLPVQVPAVASVSAPIDLAATSRNMLRRRNIVYNQRLLRDFRAEYLGHGSMISEHERQLILRARNFLDLDHDVVAPRNGFADAWDYYARAMALPHLGAIRTPTLLIQAQDDPIVPARPYLDYPWHDNDWLFALLPAGGGHVGFHGPGPEPWHLMAIGSSLGRLGL